MLGWEKKGKFKHSFVMETNWMHLGRLESWLYILGALEKGKSLACIWIRLGVLWFFKLSLEIYFEVIQGIEWVIWNAKSLRKEKVMLELYE